MVEAFWIAGLPQVQLVSEQTAMINSYILQNRSVISGYTEPKNIGFIDFGYSKISFFLITFESGKQPIKQYEDAILNLGGKNLDMALLDLVCEKFIEENDDC